MADAMSLGEFADWCQDLASKLGDDIDLSEPMRDVEQLLVEKTREGIESACSPDGTPWPDLAESTLKQRLREGGDTKPLQHLLDYIESSSDSRGASLEITHPAAAYQDAGTDRIPARPLVGVTAETADRIAEIIGDHVERILDGKK